MALPLPTLQPCLSLTSSRRQPPLLFHQHRNCFTNCTKLQFSRPIVLRKGRGNCVSRPKSVSIDGFSVPNIQGEREDGENDIGFPKRFREWVVFLQSVVPGGSWWRFSDSVEVNTAKPVTVVFALSRMWELVAKDGWVIFAAFGALIIAALMDVSIPHFLTASIFSAQSGETMVFHRNARILVLLCFTSGICRSKSCMVKAPVYYRYQCPSSKFGISPILKYNNHLYHNLQSFKEYITVVQDCCQWTM